MCFYHKINVLVYIEGQIYRFACEAGFSDQMNNLGIGLLGRHGFFELFESVNFEQNNKVIKFIVSGNPPEKPKNIPLPK